MLSSMVKEHQTRQQLRREEQERRRKEALQASTNLTNALVDHLNVGVAQAYLNQKRLDGEARRLEQSAAVLQKQTQHWITLVNGFCSALKQVGDVASWTQAIHKDVSVVAAALHHAYTTTYTSTHSTPPPPTRAITANSALGVRNAVGSEGRESCSASTSSQSSRTPVAPEPSSSRAKTDDKKAMNCSNNKSQEEANEQPLSKSLSSKANTDKEETSSVRLQKPLQKK